MGCPATFHPINHDGMFDSPVPLFIQSPGIRETGPSGLGCGDCAGMDVVVVDSSYGGMYVMLEEKLANVWRSLKTGWKRAVSLPAWTRFCGFQGFSVAVVPDHLFFGPHRIVKLGFGKLYFYLMALNGFNSGWSWSSSSPLT